MIPARVQLKRIKGWRMPVGTVSVARSTLWGNPFKVDVWGRERAIELYRDMLSGGWSPDWVADMDESKARLVYVLMGAWRRRLGTGLAIERAQAELRGLNLACWCALDDEACHAAVLLEVANS